MPAPCRTTTRPLGRGRCQGARILGVVAPLTFTSTPAMACNRRMFRSVVVGYDTYLQTEEVFEQHRPIVAGDELLIDVETLTSVRRVAGRDIITVTNTFTDTAGERVHTLHTTVVGVTADDINPGTMAAVQKAMMHDVDFSGIRRSRRQLREDSPAGRRSKDRHRLKPHSRYREFRRPERRRRTSYPSRPPVPR